MSRKEAIEILEKRRDWLIARVAIGEDRGRDFSFDRAEAKALSMGIELLKAAHAADQERRACTA